MLEIDARILKHDDPVILGNTPKGSIEHRKQMQRAGIVTSTITSMDAFQDVERNRKPDHQFYRPTYIINK